MLDKEGLLVDSTIDKFIKDKVIIAQSAFSAKQIQPSSLDLRLGKVAYRVRASFLPGINSTVMEKINNYKLHEIDLTDGAVLETNAVYVVPLQESLALPNDISVLANPKSSTGRLDVFTRLISDYSQRFDVVKAGYWGNLYIEISPRTFPIIVREGTSLNQIRFRRGKAKLLTEEDLQSYQLVSDRSNYVADALQVTLDLSPREGNLVGYKAKKHRELIDVDKVGFYKIEDFWQPIYISQNSFDFILEPNEFYILASYEEIKIPSNLAAEMVAFDPLLGEFRVHYAGFFDPGFGVGVKSKAVLEVRSFELPFVVAHRQVVGKLIFEELTNAPRQIYGDNIGSNYQAQSLKLAKQFTY